jgi:hypothetical protein
MVTITDVSEEHAASIFKVDDILSEQDSHFLEESDAVINLRVSMKTDQFRDQLSNC